MDDDDADVDVFGRGEDCGVTLFVGVLSGVCLRFERRPIFRPRRTRDVMSATLRQTPPISACLLQGCAAAVREQNLPFVEPRFHRRNERKELRARTKPHTGFHSQHIAPTHCRPHNLTQGNNHLYQT